MVLGFLMARQEHLDAPKPGEDTGNMGCPSPLCEEGNCPCVILWEERKCAVLSHFFHWKY